MATFTLTVDLDNAAFDSPWELPRILRKLADHVEASAEKGTVRDANGNTVGKWVIA